MNDYWTAVGWFRLGWRAAVVVPHDRISLLDEAKKMGGVSGSAEIRPV
jgi:hypothetical protein